MYIYRLTCPEWLGYNTFTGCVVIAQNDEQARHIHPRGFLIEDGHNSREWCQPKEVIVERIGIPLENNGPYIILSSFHDG